MYRIYTSIVFHGSLLHVFFNMLALVPLGAELERLMGSVRLLYIIVLLATCNAVFHLFIALLADHNPFHSYHLMDECSIGFSGVLFSMIVIETSLSGIQSRRSVITPRLDENVSSCLNATSVYSVKYFCFRLLLMNLMISLETLSYNEYNHSCVLTKE